MKIRNQFIKVESLPVIGSEIGIKEPSVPVVADTGYRLATDEMPVVDSAMRERRDLFWSMMQRMGINTLMVSIPTIARTLGYSPATLYVYISRGTFFLPHRVVNGSPMVAIDDLVDWLASRRHDASSESNSIGHESASKRSGKKRGNDASAIGDREALTQSNEMLKKALRLAAQASSKLATN